jgi:hypothetical protein
MLNRFEFIFESDRPAGLMSKHTHLQTDILLKCRWTDRPGLPGSTPQSLYFPLLRAPQTPGHSERGQVRNVLPTWAQNVGSQKHGRILINFVRCVDPRSTGTLQEAPDHTMALFDGLRTHKDVRWAGPSDSIPKHCASGAQHGRRSPTSSVVGTWNLEQVHKVWGAAAPNTPPYSGGVPPPAPRLGAAAPQNPRRRKGVGGKPPNRGVWGAGAPENKAGGLGGGRPPTARSGGVHCPNGISGSRGEATGSRTRHGIPHAFSEKVVFRYGHVPLRDRPQSA